MSSELIPQILSGLLTRLPLILVCAVGAIFVVARWQSLGKAALPAILGIGLTAFSSLLSAIVYPLLPGFAQGVSLSHIFMIAGIVQGMVSTAAFALIILAVFLGRPKQPA